MAILLIDFDDSFTFNLKGLLESLGAEVEVLNHRDICSMNLIDITNNYLAVIIGPGPGHPDEYRHLYSTIQQLILCNDIYLMGICLGHQLIWSCQEFSIIKRANPLHGVREDLFIPAWDDLDPRFWGQKIAVQLYNSLHVDAVGNVENFAFGKNEVFMGKLSNGITMQFHPESVGTSFPEVFFYGLKKFMYNKVNETGYKNRRSLRFTNSS